MRHLNIRQGNKQDLSSIYDLVVELAIYEKEHDSVTTTLADYQRDFDENIFEFLVAESDDRIVGMALYYMSYSTWRGRMLYLEDFVVSESMRGNGIGNQLFQAFLEKAKELDCVLTKWQVLDWNTPAVRFYEKHGATIEKEWWNGKMFVKDL